MISGASAAMARLMSAMALSASILTSDEPRRPKARDEEARPTVHSEVASRPPCGYTQSK